METHFLWPNITVDSSDSGPTRLVTSYTSGEQQRGDLLLVVVFGNSRLTVGRHVLPDKLNLGSVWASGERLAGGKEQLERLISLSSSMAEFSFVF